TDYTPARLYHPETGRFTTRDPHPTPLNKYQAFNTEPVNGIDPTGNGTIGVTGRSKRGANLHEDRLRQEIDAGYETTPSEPSELQTSRFPIAEHVAIERKMGRDEVKGATLKEARRKGFRFANGKYTVPIFADLQQREYISTQNLKNRGFFHGSDVSKVKRIEKEGLRPGRHHGPGEGIYLAKSPEVALRHANHNPQGVLMAAYTGIKPILKVRTRANGSDLRIETLYTTSRLTNEYGFLPEDPEEWARGNGYGGIYCKDLGELLVFDEADVMLIKD
ncbi:RHS repeat-associated core domain-containing protein, partial [Streptomyces sp. NRRL F-2664]|uniref:RHS repeat-associated core domain-containing protein n=1 Tax=Streptomyces sp. NRRL F-2664 TaxID=1463842 RepID=UPI002D21E987